MTATTDPPRAPTSPTPPVRLGEELPVFCERCGYSLHGLGQPRCEHCNILHFHCPECGHQQPINTLRPAFQAMLGRVRAMFLVLSVLIKIAIILGMTLIWMPVAAEWAFRVESRQIGAATGNTPPRYITDIKAREVSWDMLLGFGIFAAIYGGLGRMQLLRWRRGILVGIALALLMAGAVYIGVMLGFMDWHERSLVMPRPTGVITATALAMGLIVLSATFVWSIWSILVRVFLPKRAADALLEWQVSDINRPAAALGREPIVPSSND